MRRLDLHGLHVNEAIRCARLALQLALTCSVSHVSFVTGRGTHSGPAGARLYPAVLAYLRRWVGHAGTQQMSLHVTEAHDRGSISARLQR